MSENIVLSIETIHLEADKKKNNYLCESFKVFPEAKEKHGGFLFGLIELQATPSQESERIFDTILNTLKENYYQQITSSPDPKKLNLEAIFEFALNKTNQKLIEMIQIGQIKLVLDNLHYFIGVIKPDNTTSTCEVVFANKGYINANLVHKTPKNNYKTLNILAGQEKAIPNSNKIKVFSSITAGVLPMNDTLIISTEVFNNFLSTTQIQDVLSSNSITQAIDYFKTLIKKVKDDTATTFCALIFQYHVDDTPAQQPISQKSINKLINTTEQTEKLLTPSFALNIKQNIVKSVSVIKNMVQKDSGKLRQPNSTEIKSRKLKSRIKNIPHLISGIFKNIFSVFTGKKKPSLQSIKLFFMNIPKMFTRKPDKNTFIAIAILVLIITLSGSIFWAKQQKKQVAEQQVYETQINNVKTLINEAESSFIYKNKNKSIQKLREATKELTYLPQSTTSQQSNYTRLEKQITDIKNKVLNIEKIVPQLVTEIMINETLANHSKLSFSNNKLFSYGKDLTIAEINIGENKVEQDYTVESAPSFAVSNDDSTFFIDNGGKVYHLSGSQISTVGTIDAPDAAYFYNSNIYALYRGSGQINKYRFTGTGFSAPVSWIQNMGTANLATAKSLTIDGSIYVLNADGSITKFYSGDHENFTNPIIEPPMESASKIITKTELDSIFIFDNDSKRLAILNKTGILQKQLSFESLPSTEDIAVSDDGKKGFVLSGGKVYQFDL